MSLHQFLDDDIDLSKVDKSTYQILVAPKAVTFPEITGQKITNYPYLFNNEEEQYEIIAKLLQDNIREYKYKESNKLLLETHATKIDKLFSSFEISSFTFFTALKTDLPM